jgi:hypothetical protein
MKATEGFKLRFGITHMAMNRFFGFRFLNAFAALKKMSYSFLRKYSLFSSLLCVLLRFPQAGANAKNK